MNRTSENFAIFQNDWPGHINRRHGLVLIVVTILLALMSLAALGSVALMQSEHKASRMRGDELILENTAASAGEWLAALVQKSREQRAMALRPTENGSIFRNQNLRAATAESDEPHFAILPASMSTEDDSEIKYGFINESAKLHLQTLLDWDKKFPGSGTRALLQLPGMTPSVAEKILDWIDADSMPRMLGAEQDKYTSLRLPYSTRNAVPTTLDELLLIPGVTRFDLFGDVRTAERAESRSTKLEKSYSADSSTHVPWSQFLTVESGERNEAFDGQKRIFLNSPDLADLHRQLQVSLSLDWANFVVGYRQFGPARNPRGIAAVSFEPNFAIPPKFDFRSELDLIGTKVAIAQSGKSAVLLASPLPANRTGWAGQLSRVMDRVTVLNQPSIRGRINIELASREVLLAIPEMDPVTVDRILATRLLLAFGESEHVHATWLLEQGFVDLPRMRTIARYVTTSGDVFHAEIFAYFTDHPLFVRNFVAVDGTATEPRQLYWKDLRDRPLTFPLTALFLPAQ